MPAAKGGAGTVSGLLKANGSGTVSAALAGTDYLTPTGANAAYIQNNPASQQSGSFSVSGNGTLGGNETVAGSSTVAGAVQAGTAVTVDAAGGNTGTTAANALRFGAGNTGEGIASKRSSGGNQSGLDFYTSSAARMSITNGGNVGIGTSSPGQALEVNGNVLVSSANDYLLRDTNHGLGWYGTGKLWNGASVDGPALYGYGGGVLGTNQGGTRTTALAWNSAGQVGIGTSTPNAAALLDVSSTAKGLLPPRMTTAQRDAIAPAATAAGLLIYNLDTKAANQWDGTQWQVTTAAASGTFPAGSPQTFNYTGGTQTYTVPAGVTSVQVTATGGGGGGTTTGTGAAAGAVVSALVPVTPGEQLIITVGGRGGNASSSGYVNGGYNGGGNAYATGGGSGGGATDLRRNPIFGTTDDYLSSRNGLLVAAGGGGAGLNTATGGAAGTTAGGNGGAIGGGFNYGGKGATQAGPGGPASLLAPGVPGSNGNGGGNPNNGTFGSERGGGGGGYYGGASGAYYSTFGSGASDAGGGGGSSWATAGAGSPAYTTAGSSANGQLIITPQAGTSPPAPALSGANITGVIKNQTSQQTQANFNIDGAGTVGGRLTAGSVAVTGFVGIGTTAPGSDLEIRSASPTGLNLTTTAGDPNGVLTINVPTTNTACAGCSELVQFTRPGAGIGSITMNATSNGVSYNTTSDKRLKEHIGRTRFGLADLLKLEVKDYHFIGQATAARSTGFLAQDLFKIYPEAVKEGDYGPTVTNQWGVDYGKLTPLLVQAIQDQQALIDQQRAELNALKTQNAALQTGSAADHASLLSLQTQVARLLGADGQARK